MVACAKVIVFFWLFCCFSLLLKKQYKIGFSDDFEMLIFSFLGQKSKVNNLATVGSITWPHFFAKKLEKCGQVIDPTVFTCVSVIFFVFFVNLILPAERRRFLKKNKTKQQKTIKKVAKLLTYGGQVIDPTAHIYMYIYMCCRVKNWSKICFCVQFGPKLC